MFCYQKGIKLFGADFYLDAERVVPFSFVSHGHTDHLRNHKRVLATPPTARFHKLRHPKSEVLTVDFNHPVEVEGYQVELLPAGHILGSAQILVQKDGTSLLYTGDFKVRHGSTCEPIEIRHADILIMESTYGHPDYQFASPQQLEEALDQFIRKCLRWGEVPIVLAYALGKAQEAVRMINGFGYRVLVHPSVAKFADVYQAFGYDIGPYELWQEGAPADGVLVVPPHATRKPIFSNIGLYRTLLLSGWANSNGRYRFGADEAIPFSDHADFRELLDFVEQVRPKRIYTTHGFEEFPAYLRAAGFDARPLRSGGQLSLF